jgi:hypothetical protein
MGQISLGWVARRKINGEFAGHRARCKVYTTRKMALHGARGWVPDCQTSGNHRRSRPELDDEVLAKWDVVEVFATFPE